MAHEITIREDGFAEAGVSKPNVTERAIVEHGGAEDVPADLFFPVITRFAVCGKESGLGWRVRRVFEHDELTEAIRYAEGAAARQCSSPIRVLASTGEVVYEVKRNENQEEVMMDWKLELPASPARGVFRVDLDDDAHAEIDNGHTMLRLYICHHFDQPVSEDADTRAFTEALIARTREVLAIMEASIAEPDKRVEFPAEVDPVAALERG